MVLSVIGYDPIGSWTKSAVTVDELLGYRNTGGVNWINVNGLKDAQAISRLAQAYGIHMLTVEDILNTEHRPKVEEFDDYIYFTLKAISWKEALQPEAGETGGVEYEQISVVLTGDTVITFQEEAGDSFDPIRRRIDANLGRIRKMGPDYLAYGIVDSIVDSYFLVLERLGTELELFETRAIEETGRAFMRELQAIKQEVLRMRRAIWPLRESIGALVRMETELISGELAPFLKDLHDNVVQAAETMESYRELTAGILEVNLSSVSNRMNEVMKVLTIISTIFIPLTFIVGVYGMNFRFMPELESRWGYPLAWGVMAVIAGAMVAFFKKRKWM
ncbi:MAG: magnesium and cobalt transport protein CorA [Treponema sp. GWB1_62_6]|nr:MAG: magnesium and cobalt transport protein CorA [Treponema sp. GWB1_62_6]HCM26122.1 magnesium and cobalt transport protein CorA [Treponema sp.]